MFVNLPKNKVAKDVKKSKAKFFGESVKYISAMQKKGKSIAANAKIFPVKN